MKPGTKRRDCTRRLRMGEKVFRKLELALANCGGSGLAMYPGDWDCWDLRRRSPTREQKCSGCQQGIGLCILFVGVLDFLTWRSYSARRVRKDLIWNLHPLGVCKLLPNQASLQSKSNHVNLPAENTTLQLIVPLAP